MERSLEEWEDSGTSGLRSHNVAAAEWWPLPADHCSSVGDNFTLQGALAGSGNIFGHRSWGESAAGSPWVEAGDAAHTL